MALEFHPPAKDFEATSSPQLVYTRIINDMDTPVSADLTLMLFGAD